MENTQEKAQYSGKVKECPRHLNGYELALLEDREYIRTHTEIISGHRLNDEELDKMIAHLKEQ